MMVMTACLPSGSAVIFKRGDDETVVKRFRFRLTKAIPSITRGLHPIISDTRGVQIRRSGKTKTQFSRVRMENRD